MANCTSRDQIKVYYNIFKDSISRIGLSPRAEDAVKEKGRKEASPNVKAETRPKLRDDKVEAALRVLKQSSLDRSYDPINSIFVNHAKDRRLQLRCVNPIKLQIL